MKRKHRATDRGRSSFDRNATNDSTTPLRLHPDFLAALAKDDRTPQDREDDWKRDLELIIKEHDEQGLHRT